MKEWVGVNCNESDCGRRLPFKVQLWHSWRLIPLAMRSSLFGQQSFEFGHSFLFLEAQLWAEFEFLRANQILEHILILVMCLRAADMPNAEPG